MKKCVKPTNTDHVPIITNTDISSIIKIIQEKMDNSPLLWDSIKEEYIIGDKDFTISIGECNG